MSKSSFSCWDEAARKWSSELPNIVHGNCTIILQRVRKRIVITVIGADQDRERIQKSWDEFARLTTDSDPDVSSIPVKTIRNAFLSHLQGG